MIFRIFVFTSSILLSTSVFSADVEIKSVKIVTMTSAHLCQRLGGQGKDPKLTIRHEKIAGARIRIRMFDTVSNGRTVEHRSTSVRADGSGVTIVSYNFLPPCNTTGNSVSSYKFLVSSGRSSTTVNWGRYDSGKKRILP